MPDVVIALYAPRTQAAFDVLLDALADADIEYRVELPEPAPRSTLKYGVLPYGAAHVSCTDVDTVDRVVNEVHDALLREFGAAALEVNDALIGEIPPQP